MLQELVGPGGTVGKVGGEARLVQAQREHMKEKLTITRESSIRNICTSLHSWSTTMRITTHKVFIV
jgi:hypothetical protein